jgi:hypothetical protein
MKYYTEVFYIIYERNVPSIQCKVRLDRLSSREEIDALSLSLIDFYVPALTPRFHRSKAALRLSENITFPAISHTDTYHQQRGPRGPPWCVGIAYTQIVQGRGQHCTLWHPCLYFPRHGKFTFNRNSESSVGQ